MRPAPRTRRSLVASALHRGAGDWPAWRLTWCPPICVGGHHPGGLSAPVQGELAGRIRTNRGAGIARDSSARPPDRCSSEDRRRRCPADVGGRTALSRPGVNRSGRDQQFSRDDLGQVPPAVFAAVTSSVTRRPISSQERRGLFSFDCRACSGIRWRSPEPFNELIDLVRLIRGAEQLDQPFRTVCTSGALAKLNSGSRLMSVGRAQLVERRHRPSPVIRWPSRQVAGSPLLPDTGQSFRQPASFMLRPERQSPEW